ncbi:MAG: phosphoglycerate mutase family protein [Pseudomonadota bacterium]|nr:phosphoglycerate mutase family protein [Pseudomonadota bacterium]
MKMLARVAMWVALAAAQTASLAAAEVGAAISGSNAEQLVILVRHAEKALDQGKDPGLTSVGEARAQSLRHVLEHANVAVIITTEWQRTRATATPLAESLKLTPIVVDSSAGPADGHADRVAAAVRKHQADVVLVVGHSNTVPAIIKALGGPAVAAIGDADYGNLYLLWRRPGQVRLIQARY